MNFSSVTSILSIFNFRDNPLFLQNWRERTRPSIIISVTIVVSLIVGLLLTNAIITKSYYYQYINGTRGEQILLPWQSKFLIDIATLQGIVLLLFGTAFSFRMTSRERQSGTLDFHRSSPTPVYNQIFGLTFGASCLEWCVALFLFALSCVLISMTPHLSFLPYIKFFCGLSLCAYLYHCAAALLALVFGGYKKTYSGVIVIFFIFYALSYFLMFSQMSFGYHLTWLPAYEQLFIVLKGVGYVSFYGYQRQKLLYLQFGYKVSPFLFLLCAQVPLIGVFLSGIGRQIRKPEFPIFTKGQTLLLTLFILFLFTGSFFSGILLTESVNRYNGWHLNYMLNIFFTLVVVLGILGALNATPKQLQYVKGLRRMKRDVTFKLRSGDDQSTNIFWYGSFAAIVTIVITFYYVFFKFSFLDFITALILLLSYVAFFAGFLEYFRFSKHYRKKAVFWTVLIVLWVLLPMLGVILKSIFQMKILLQILQILSPFTGGIQAISTVLAPYTYHSSHATYSLLPGTIVVFISAVLMLFLARQQRNRLWKTEMRDIPDQTAQTSKVSAKRQAF